MVVDFSLSVCLFVLSLCGVVPTHVLWECSVHCFPECHLADPLTGPLAFLTERVKGSRF